MKNKKVLLIVLAFIAIFGIAAVVAISLFSSKNEHAYSIPKNAFMVVSFDAASIADKTGILDDKDFIQSKIEELGIQGNQEKLIKTLLNNPLKSGINATKRIYGAIVIEDEYTVYGMTTLAVNDKDDLKNFIEDYAEGIELEESGDMLYWYDEYDDICLAFNDNRCLIVGGSVENLEDLTKALLIQKEEESVVANKSFNKLESENKDVHLLVCCPEDLLNIAKQERELRTIFASLPEDLDFTDLAILSTLNFEKGKVVLKTSYYTENEKLKELYENYNYTKGEIDDELLIYIPENNIFFTAYSLDGEKLMKTLDKELKKTMDLTSEEEAEAYNFVTTFINNISGTVILSVNNENSLSLISQIDNANEIISSIDYAIDYFALPIEKISKTTYKISEEEVIATFGTQDNILYFQIDRYQATKALKEYNNSIADSEYSDDITDNLAYCKVNINELLSSKEILREIGLDNLSAGMIKNLLDDLIIKSDNSEFVIAELTTDNKKENLLEIIYKEVKKFF